MSKQTIKASSRQGRLCIRENNITKLTDMTEQYCSHITCQCFITRPCLICGQMDHSLVNWTQDNNKEWQSTMKCPVSRYDTWEELKKEDIERCRYNFQAEKFVTQYDYNRDKVMEAFRIYEEFGYGRIIRRHSPILHAATRAALIMICNKKGRLWEAAQTTLSEYKKGSQQPHEDC